VAPAAALAGTFSTTAVTNDVLTSSGSVLA